MSDFPADHPSLERLTDPDGYLRCDALGCTERHPLSHELLGDECFAPGRWLGWIYLDLNRPDLFDREVRFCSTQCCLWWLEQQIVTKQPRQLTEIDKAIRQPKNEVAARLAGLRRRPPVESGA